jgi:hypothetical protein
LNFLRIKQAQCALADGRLDEAHALLSRDGVRSHRQGQRLATKLVKAYLKRGKDHLQEGRLSEALSDCQKASALGGHQKDVAELRGEVVGKMDDKRRDADRRDLTLDGARHHAREGFLSKGVAMLRGVHGDSARVERAEQELELHRTKADAVLERGGLALDREDWAAAGHHIAEARRLRPFDRRVDELAGRLSDEATAKARAVMVRGRVDIAQALLRAVSPAAGDDLGVQEMREAVGQVALASQAIQSGDARTAGRGLRKVKALLPGAKWVDEAIKQTQRIIDSRDALESGPLGLICDGYAFKAPASPAAHPAPPSQSPTHRHTTTDTRVTTPIAYHKAIDETAGRSHDVLPKQFLIQVDGAGSALTLCNAVVTVGPVSSPDRPDVGLIADPSVPTVTIQRTQDDYFLRSTQPVKVNGKTTNERLLSDGDKIELSPRCRFKFRLPHAASTTAVLEMSGTRLVRADVKRVILLDRQLVIGAGPACHLRADSAEEPVILGLRDGRLMLQSKQTMKVAGDDYGPQVGEPGAPGAGVPMDTPVNLGTMTLRITQA